MIEVLKMVKKCKIYKNKGSSPGKPVPLRFDQNICPEGRDLAVFENLLRGCLGGC